jgi:hypothetical protein
MIACPHCGRRLSDFPVKTEDVRVALLTYPNLPHKKIGHMFGVSRRRVWGIAERYGIATRHRSDRGRRKKNQSSTP